MARMKRVAVAAAAFLLAATTAWAHTEPIGGYPPGIEAILVAYYVLTELVPIGGGLFGAATIYGYLCRKMKLRLFRAEGLRFTLSRFACFAGMAVVIGWMLSWFMGKMGWPLYLHVLWIHANLSGNSVPYSDLWEIAWW